MDIQFPLFVLEKHDRSTHLIETPERVLYQVEAIDLEDSEYLSGIPQEREYVPMARSPETCPKSGQ
jgi:hypothetical protein